MEKGKNIDERLKKNGKQAGEKRNNKHTMRSDIFRF